MTPELDSREAVRAYLCGVPEQRRPARGGFWVTVKAALLVLVACGVVYPFACYLDDSRRVERAAAARVERAKAKPTKARRSRGTDTVRTPMELPPGAVEL